MNYLDWVKFPLVIYLEWEEGWMGLLGSNIPFFVEHLNSWYTKICFRCQNIMQDSNYRKHCVTELLHVPWILCNFYSSFDSFSLNVLYISGWKPGSPTGCWKVWSLTGLQILNLCPILDKKINVKIGGTTCQRDQNSCMFLSSLKDL